MTFTRTDISAMDLLWWLSFKTQFKIQLSQKCSEKVHGIISIFAKRYIWILTVLVHWTKDLTHDLKMDIRPKFNLQKTFIWSLRHHVNVYTVSLGLVFRVYNTTASIFLFSFSNGIIRTICEICSKLPIQIILEYLNILSILEYLSILNPPGHRTLNWTSYVR